MVLCCKHTMQSQYGVSMSRLDRAMARVANANRRYKEAFDELREASTELQELISQQQDAQWQSITKQNEGKGRRPKGEIEKLVVAIFQNGVPGPLTFQEIMSSLKLKVSPEPSHSTVRQTLYRMQNKQLLENYSGRFSTGFKMPRKNL